MASDQRFEDDPGAHWRMLGLAFGAFLLVFIVWQAADNNSIVLYPFRLLVTFVHEAGHGLSAILTGGRFLNFVIEPNGAGVAITSGGNRFIVIQMGYLGAAFFGAALLYAANRARRTRWVAFAVGVFFAACALLFTGGGSVFVIGVIVALGLWLIAGTADERARLLQVGALLALLVTLFLIRENTALLVGIIAGAALIGLGAFASPPITVFVLNVLALLVCFNAITDILGLFRYPDLRSTGGLPNDALALADMTGTPVQLWLLLWMAFVIAALGVSVYAAFIRPARRRAANDLNP
jgi:hypothetical protein